MPTVKKVTVIHSKLPDGENTAVVSERTAKVMEAAGWKIAPKSKQSDSSS
jgi:hypothetical protein